MCVCYIVCMYMTLYVAAVVAVGVVGVVVVATVGFVDGDDAISHAPRTYEEIFGPCHKTHWSL